MPCLDTVVSDVGFEEEQYTKSMNSRKEVRHTYLIIRTSIHHCSHIANVFLDRAHSDDSSRIEQMGAADKAMAQQMIRQRASPFVPRTSQMLA